MNKLLKDKKIGILMGGFGSEKNISLRSGKHVYNLLKNEGYQVEKIDVGKDFFLKQKKCQFFDIFFNALHGVFGEDGHIQGCLELLEIPYTGENLLSSALAFNKIKTKEILLSHEILMSKHVVLKDLKITDHLNVLKEIKAKGLIFPFFLKKISSGSSIEVFLVENESEWEKHYIYLKSKSQLNAFYIENKIEGMEITVGIYKNKETLKMLPILEIVSNNQFYDYEAKYTQGKTKLKTADFLSAKNLSDIKQIVCKIYQIFNFSSCVRIDFIFEQKSNKPYFLEINTQPGMTELSDIPAMLKIEKSSMTLFIENLLLQSLMSFKSHLFQSI